SGRAGLGFSLLPTPKQPPCCEVENGSRVTEPPQTMVPFFEVYPYSKGLLIFTSTSLCPSASSEARTAPAPSTPHIPPRSSAPPAAPRPIHSGRRLAFFIAARSGSSSIETAYHREPGASPSGSCTAGVLGSRDPGLRGGHQRLHRRDGDHD